MGENNCISQFFRHKRNYQLKGDLNSRPYLKNWPVELREEGVFVGLEESSFWNIFG